MLEIPGIPQVINWTDFEYAMSTLGFKLGPENYLWVSRIEIDHKGLYVEFDATHNGKPLLSNNKAIATNRVFIPFDTALPKG